VSQLSNLYVIDFEVYIAGVKMPNTSVTLTSAFNSIPTCTVAMPPDARLFSIGRQDRVPLQVFVSDTLNGPSWEIALEKETDIPNYLLLFDGEISDFAYTSTGLNKEVAVTAEAIPSFLRQLQIKLLLTDEDYTTASQPQSNIGSAIVAGHNTVTFPSSLFMFGLAPLSRANKTLEYPTDFLDNIIAFITNTATPPPQATNAVLEFYKKYCDNIKLGSRYTRVPYFDDSTHNVSWNNGTLKPGFPLLMGLQAQSLFQLGQSLVNSGPTQDSIYNLINYVMASLEYELAVISAPAYVSGKMVQLCLKPLLYEALPPACNILFRSHVNSLSLNENVTEPPTRILYRDMDTPAAKEVISSGSNVAAAILNTYFWPYNIANTNNNTPPGISSLTASLLLPAPGPPIITKEMSEEFCGPKVFETTAPPWMGYLSGSDPNDPNNEGIKPVCEHLMEHVYRMKKYERREMDVVTSFNPYVTPGFPGVVYDTRIEEDSTVLDAAISSANLKFIGQVMVVSHTLTKNSVSTRVQLGFTRLLVEEKQSPMSSTLKEISDEVTHQVAPMTEVYNALLGPTNPPRTIADLLAETGDTFKQAQLDPSAAYKFIKRNIMTRKQYKDFMGCDAASANFTGDYFTKRLDTNLVQTLKDVAAFQCGRSVFKE